MSNQSEAEVLRELVEANDDEPLPQATLRIEWVERMTAAWNRARSLLSSTAGAAQEEAVRALICPRCKVDRFKSPCPGPLSDCAMRFEARTSMTTPSVEGGKGKM